MTQPEDTTSGQSEASEQGDSDLHGTAEEVAEGTAGDDDAQPTPGGG